MKYDVSSLNPLTILRVYERHVFFRDKILGKQSEPLVIEYGFSTGNFFN